jgi:alpha-glucosidase
MWSNMANPLLGSTQQQVMSATPSLADCPGYIASNVVYSATGIIADLQLAGTPCNVYGKDIYNLTLEVECQSGM